jgi:hypothetical protein
MQTYAPLQGWLAAQPPNFKLVPATFEQVEGVLGFALPRNAWRKPHWWENNPTQHSHARAWLEAGFVAHVNIPNGTVTFRRRGN